MTCAEALRVQAYFDGEMDPGEAASIDKHLPRCAEMNNTVNFVLKTVKLSAGGGQLCYQDGQTVRGDGHGGYVNALTALIAS